MKTHLSKKESGIGVIALLFWLAVIVVLGGFVAKIFPSYYDYWSLEHVIHSQIMNTRAGESRESIRQAFRLRLQVASLHIPSQDIHIEKNGSGQTKITVSYDKSVPLIANASLHLKFIATGKTK